MGQGWNLNYSFWFLAEFRMGKKIIGKHFHFENEKVEVKVQKVTFSRPQS